MKKRTPSRSRRRATRPRRASSSDVSSFHSETDEGDNSIDLTPQLSQTSPDVPLEPLLTPPNATVHPEESPVIGPAPPPQRPANLKGRVRYHAAQLAEAIQETLDHNKKHKLAATNGLQPLEQLSALPVWSTGASGQHPATLMTVSPAVKMSKLHSFSATNTSFHEFAPEEGTDADDAMDWPSSGEDDDSEQAKLGRIEEGDEEIDRERCIGELESIFDEHQSAFDILVDFFTATVQGGASVRLSSFMRECSHHLMRCRRKIAAGSNFRRVVQLLRADAVGCIAREDRATHRIKELEGRVPEIEEECLRLRQEVVRAALLHTRLALGLERRDDGAPPSDGGLTFVRGVCLDTERMWEDLDQRMGQVVMQTYARVFAELLAWYRGYEMDLDTVDGAFLAVFQYPVDALNFSMAFQRQLLLEEWPTDLLQHEYGCRDLDGVMCGLRVRLAIHTGPCTRAREAASKRMQYSGRAVDVVSLLPMAAHPGQTLLTKETVEALRELPGLASQGASYVGQATFPDGGSDDYEVKRIAAVQVTLEGKTTQVIIHHSLLRSLQKRRDTWFLTSGPQSAQHMQGLIDVAIKKLEEGGDGAVPVLNKLQVIRDLRLEVRKLKKHLASAEEALRGKDTTAITRVSVVSEVSLDQSSADNSPRDRQDETLHVGKTSEPSQHSGRTSRQSNLRTYSKASKPTSASLQSLASDRRPPDSPPPPSNPPPNSPPPSSPPPNSPPPSSPPPDSPPPSNPPPEDRLAEVTGLADSRISTFTLSGSVPKPTMVAVMTQTDPLPSEPPSKPSSLREPRRKSPESTPAVSFKASTASAGVQADDIATGSSRAPSVREVRIAPSDSMLFRQGPAVGRIHRRVRLFNTLIQHYLFDTSFPFIEAWVPLPPERAQAFETKVHNTVATHTKALRFIQQQIHQCERAGKKHTDECKNLVDEEKAIEERKRNTLEQIKTARDEEQMSLFISWVQKAVENEDDEAGQFERPDVLEESITAILSKLWLFLRGCVLGEALPCPKTDTAEPKNITELTRQLWKAPRPSMFKRGNFEPTQMVGFPRMESYFHLNHERWQRKRQTIIQEKRRSVMSNAVLDVAQEPAKPEPITDVGMLREKYLDSGKSAGVHTELRQQHLLFSPPDAEVSHTRHPAVLRVMDGHPVEAAERSEHHVGGLGEEQAEESAEPQSSPDGAIPHISQPEKPFVVRKQQTKKADLVTAEPARQGPVVPAGQPRDQSPGDVLQVANERAPQDLLAAYKGQAVASRLAPEFNFITQGLELARAEEEARCAPDQVTHRRPPRLAKVKQPRRTPSITPIRGLLSPREQPPPPKERQRTAAPSALGPSPSAAPQTPAKMLGDGDLVPRECVPHRTLHIEERRADQEPAMGLQIEVVEEPDHTLSPHFNFALETLSSAELTLQSIPYKAARIDADSDTSHSVDPHSTLASLPPPQLPKVPLVGGGFSMRPASGKAKPEAIQADHAAPEYEGEEALTEQVVYPFPIRRKWRWASAASAFLSMREESKQVEFNSLKHSDSLARLSPKASPTRRRTMHGIVNRPESASSAPPKRVYVEKCRT